MEIKSGNYAAGIMEKTRLVNMEPKDSARQTIHTVFLFLLFIYIIPKIMIEIKRGKQWTGVMKIIVDANNIIRWRCSPRLRDEGAAEEMYRRRCIFLILYGIIVKDKRKDVGFPLQDVNGVG